MGCEERVFIALGSNLGHKSAVLFAAIHKLKEFVRITSTSFLYKTAPMYVEEQPSFYNAVCEIRTALEPTDLLSALQQIEANRRTQRYGPRSLDLDILMFGNRNINSEHLIVPHPRMAERDFVLFPLRDIDRQLLLPTGETVDQACQSLSTFDKESNRPPPLRVFHCGEKATEFLWGERTLTMGVLNVTPDSFSDGGEFFNVDAAVNHAKALCDVDIIDVGGQSTKPGTDYVSEEEELSRVLPVIKAIRELVPSAIISIDTFRHHVAQQAVQAGANIVNDVSAGLLDEQMLDTVVSLGVPYIAMHMRGTSKNMMQLTDYHSYSTTVDGIADELQQRIDGLLEKGFPRWLLIADPGFGFAKNHEQNMELLQGLSNFKNKMGELPILVGVSRKGFIAKTAGCSSKDEESDWATAAAVTASIALGADIVRFHRPEIIYTVKVADEIFRKLRK
eukprot:jgi/Galph1/3728/GphlegSOOS_G2435.1